MPHLFSRFHHHDKPAKPAPPNTTLSLTKSAPGTNTTTTDASQAALQPLAKNRTVGPEVSKMKEWDWADGRRKDSGTGAAFLEDVRVGMASPKTSIAAGAGPAAVLAARHGGVGGNGATSGLGKA